MSRVYVYVACVCMCVRACVCVCVSSDGSPCEKTCDQLENSESSAIRLSIEPNRTYADVKDAPLFMFLVLRPNWSMIVVLPAHIHYVVLAVSNNLTL